MRYTKPRAFTAYIAVAAQGHPAVFLGYALTKRELKARYSEKYNGDLEVAGYAIAKVRVTDDSVARERAS